MTNQEQYELICEKAKKYDRLVGVLKKIRAEIAVDMADITKEAKQTQDDVDLGKGIGLQIAFDTVNKHMAGGKVRNDHNKV